MRMIKSIAATIAFVLLFFGTIHGIALMDEKIPHLSTVFFGGIFLTIFGLLIYAVFSIFYDAFKDKDPAPPRQDQPEL